VRDIREHAQAAHFEDDLLAKIRESISWSLTGKRNRLASEKERKCHAAFQCGARISFFCANRTLRTRFDGSRGQKRRFRGKCLCFSLDHHFPASQIERYDLVTIMETTPH
jgi:hypothetical protein